MPRIRQNIKWYRAPEQLLKLQNYGPPADIWAVGATLAEIMTRKPLFPGKNENDQLRLICSSRGHPAVVGWREGAKAAARIDPRLPRATPSSLASVLVRVSQPVIQLIEDMLQLDPTARPSAAMALEYPIFRLHMDTIETPGPGCRQSRATTEAISSRVYSANTCQELRSSAPQCVTRHIACPGETITRNAQEYFEIPNDYQEITTFHSKESSDSSRRLRSPAGAFNMTLKRRSPTLHRSGLPRYSNSIRNINREQVENFKEDQILQRKMQW
jgi:serine/threonine protein kinase